MNLKDYYTILELPPSASLDDVKKAYRRLAMIHHPDKKGDDIHFAEIKQAYETLTNPSKKDIYLQQRWYAQSTGRRMTATVVTPVSILKQLLELNKYASRLDIHRMDKEGLYEYMSDILSDDTIQKINSFREESVNKEIVTSALQTGQLLSYRYANELGTRLQKINNHSLQDQIQEFVRHKKSNEVWEKQKIWIVIAVVILLIVGIYFASK